MLDERKRKILQAIIQDYISTAEPIGSRTIARKYNLGVSPATIRNEMADLELLGYIEQLHTSSGRIPSAKGYRLYVDDLLKPAELTENEKNLIQSWYDVKAKRIEEVFQQTAKLISRMTKNVSLVLAPQLSQATFRYMQFVPFDESRVIVVVMTDAGFAENKIIAKPEGTTMEDLQKIAAAINKYLSGKSLDSLTKGVLSRMRSEVIAEPEVFEKAISTIAQVLATEKKERVYLGGTTQLLMQPEFKDVEKVKNILLMLEEDQLLCDLLHSTSDKSMAVTIGKENKFSGIQDCSIISASYKINGQVIGSIAVLGPTRMEYGRIMTLLDFMNKNLSDILAKHLL
jgi:heat-inducible transcriptional repressor